MVSEHFFNLGFKSELNSVFFGIPYQQLFKFTSLPFLENFGAKSAQNSLKKYIIDLNLAFSFALAFYIFLKKGL
jgi:hypothetical protein